MSNINGFTFPFCIICEKNTSNVAFNCGHITTCGVCAFCISFCAECNQIAGERVKVEYNEQLKAIMIEKLQQPQPQQ